MNTIEKLQDYINTVFTHNSKLVQVTDITINFELNSVIFEVTYKPAISLNYWEPLYIPVLPDKLKIMSINFAAKKVIFIKYAAFTIEQLKKYTDEIKQTRG